jgi:hypothetical protein
MNSLMGILNEKGYTTDKHTHHKYIQSFYEERFIKFQNKKINLLEIGILRGESLKLWCDYFDDAKVVGIDIFVRVPRNVVEQNLIGYDVDLRIIDSFNENNDVRDKFIEEWRGEGFDVIIDDGLHTGEAQLKTFRNFSPLMKKNGVYVIEDVRDESMEMLASEIKTLGIRESQSLDKYDQKFGVIEF